MLSSSRTNALNIVADMLRKLNVNLVHNHLVCVIIVNTFSLIFFKAMEAKLKTHREQTTETQQRQ